MDYDTKLDYFKGLTAYEVSKIGYKEHHSQQYTWFTKWINGKNNEYTKATDIKKYPPTEFGLYRTIVGDDVKKDDMFENLTFRKNQISLQEEIEEPIEPEKENTTIEKKPSNKNIIKKNLILLIIATIVTIAVIICIIKHKKK